MSIRPSAVPQQGELELDRVDGLDAEPEFWLVEQAPPAGEGS